MWCLPSVTLACEASLVELRRFPIATEASSTVGWGTVGRIKLQFEAFKVSTSGQPGIGDSIPQMYVQNVTGPICFHMNWHGLPICCL